MNFVIANELTALIEVELFTLFDTAIFKGAVLEINHIELDFNGSIKCRAIAQIRVHTVYRGPCNAGDTVSALLPCPFIEGIWGEDNDTVYHMRAGVTGIFMPVIYNEASVWEGNEAVLTLKGVADCGFADGTRFAFLQRGNSLVFARFAYESISDATTLDEVEEFILNMIGS